jgi:hypothetical protein
MSVYTALSFEQIQNFVNGYGKTLQSVTPIQNGLKIAIGLFHALMEVKPSSPCLKS